MVIKFQAFVNPFVLTLSHTTFKLLIGGLPYWRMLHVSFYIVAL